MLRGKLFGQPSSEVKEARENGDVRAAFAFSQLEEYRKAIQGHLDKLAYFNESEPFAVYTFDDDSGEGLVLYQSGWAYQLGSQMRYGLITCIKEGFMIATDEEIGEETVINFNGPYLSGRVVDSDGLGFQRIPFTSEDELRKNWKRG